MRAGGKRSIKTRESWNEPRGGARDAIEISSAFLGSVFRDRQSASVPVTEPEKQRESSPPPPTSTRRHLCPDSSDVEVSTEVLLAG